MQKLGCHFGKEGKERDKFFNELSPSQTTFFGVVGIM